MTNPNRVPPTPAALAAYLRDVKELHMHYHDAGSTHRWFLALSPTALCGTDRCFRLVLA